MDILGEDMHAYILMPIVRATAFSDPRSLANTVLFHTTQSAQTFVAEACI